MSKIKAAGRRIDAGHVVAGAVIAAAALTSGVGFLGILGVWAAVTR